LVRIQRTRPAVDHDLGKANHGIERRAQFVRHVGKKLALESVRFLNAKILFFQFPASLVDFFLFLLLREVANVSGKHRPGFRGNGSEG